VVLHGASLLRAPRRDRRLSVDAGGVRAAARPPLGQVELRGGEQLLELILDVVRLAGRRQRQVRRRKRRGVDG